MWLSFTGISIMVAAVVMILVIIRQRRRAARTNRLAKHWEGEPVDPSEWIP